MSVMIFMDVILDEQIPNEFNSIEAARHWVQNNLGVFDNTSRICIVDFDNLKTIFMQARTTVTIEEI